MIKFFLMPLEVCYYVIIPILLILLAYFIFSICYKRKKGTYYYNYVVDYVYSTLGIIFCSLLFCLLLGYSIASLQILSVNGVLKDYLFLVIVLVVLPIVPSCFLVYIVRIYLKNLKRKEILDKALEENNSKEIEVELKKKNSSY